MHHADVIVIGSGIAGLNFALRAAEKGLKTVILTKKKAQESATDLAQGGIAAVISKLDNFEKHYKDTLAAGAFHNDKKAVRFMVKNGPIVLQRLLTFGVPFAKRGKILQLTREGGHSERRIAFVSDYTGHAIEKTLIENVLKKSNIVVRENSFAVKLLIRKNTCYGVQTINNKKVENIFANTTVIATGGIGQVYSNTTNPEISTGDGIAMAYEAGCDFKDLEFVQFHPTVLNLKGKPKFLISEAVRGEGAYLLNSKGERFMIKIHEMAELAPRDVVARAVYAESRKGPVYLDVRHKGKTFLKQRFRQIYKTLNKYGIDMSRNKVPVAPAAHYLCGGIKVNLNGETGVKNLFAFGETARTGVHGANRLASNSLLEALVFSDEIAGNLKKKRMDYPEFKTFAISNLTIREQKKINKMKTRLRDIMWKNVGIVRTKKSLENALSGINKLMKSDLLRIKKNIEIAELNNMLRCSELITKAALKRRRSLGCHYRLS